VSFWYGLGFADMAEMPIASIQAYLERLPARIAEMKLAMAEAVSVPHLEADERRDLLESWQEQAHLREMEAEVVSPAVLRMMGIGATILAPTGEEAEEHG
jgi:hypothetical protein